MIICAGFTYTGCYITMHKTSKGVINHINYKDISKFGLTCSAGEPTSLAEAHGDVKWKKDMEEEYIALRKNKTWHLVPRNEGN